jgi:hypothetical protein
LDFSFESVFQCSIRKDHLTLAFYIANGLFFLGREDQRKTINPTAWLHKLRHLWPRLAYGINAPHKAQFILSLSVVWKE